MIVFSELSERLIHDFIALTLFVGNDYLPQVPGQSIRNGALDMLLRFYKKELIVADNSRPIKFSHIIGPDKRINVRYMSRMFDEVGQQCEHRQVADDINGLKWLKQQLESCKTRDADRTGGLAKLVKREWGDLAAKIGDGVASKFGGRRAVRLSAEEKASVLQEYKAVYYRKFHRLQLQHRVNAVQKMDGELKRMMVLQDIKENLLESGGSGLLGGRVDGWLEEQVKVRHYYGFHKLVRSYLKTLQWVVNYYLTPGGCVQWDWEFPYPFTPLCSDMAMYCQLYSGLSAEDAGDSDDSAIEQQTADYEEMLAAESLDDTINRLVEHYKGPKFKFREVPPKTPLL